MKIKINIQKEPRSLRWLSRIVITSSLLLGIALTTMPLSMPAQRVVDPNAQQYTRPSWWFGVAGAGNLNFYEGSTQRLTDDLIAPVAFQQGLGLGLYLAPLVEFHRPTSNWGLMFQVGYDSRRGTYATEFSPCDCPRDLMTKLSYVTMEPSLRFAPGKSDFYIYLGPRVAMNIMKSFKYEQGPNPNIPEQTAEPVIEGDLSEVKPVLLSGQVGVGYDIQLSPTTRKTQWVLSPFVAFQPYFGQFPREIETWNITTLRAGVTLKFGQGRAIPATRVEVRLPTPVVIVEPKVDFTVNAPKNIPAQRKVREAFPLRNYVFFDSGSTALPTRYVKLRSDQVQDFEEKQVPLFTPKNLGGRSERQMIVYYNILNILGDRMAKDPSTTITLVGSSEQGPAAGVAMATSVKTYLVDVFKIDEKRIKVEGRTRPESPSQSGTSRERHLLREDDRRVSIESNSPTLLMEFASGSSAPLKSIEIMSVQEAPIESYVTFDAKGARALASWSLEIVDEKGIVQRFGPYTQEKVSIPGKSILGTRPEGDYTITMIGQTQNGTTIRETSHAHLVLWTPPVTDEVMRYSVLYEFDASETVDLYKKYLTEVVVPKIPKNSKVIIHGYTDEIGEVGHNEELSVARAKDVLDIMQAAVAKTGRTDVQFEAYGFGEDPNYAQFDSNSPEERFFNRSVVIDIVPAQ